MKQNNWVGVDTHKETLACYKNGKFKEFKTNKNGYESAVKWAGDDSKWAVEGAYCFGRPFTFFLIRRGCKVYEINPLLTKNWRKVISMANSKNDFGDAKVISMFVDESNVQEVSFKAVELKEKLTARNLAVKQRTEITNSIKMLFSQRGKELPFNDLTTDKSAKWISCQDDIIIKNFGNLLISLNLAIKELEKEIKKNLPKQAEKLIQLKGIGEITAATIYTETKGKLLSREKLASYSGVAPVENSSGKQVKHRNNKGGNRILNSIFYRLSIHQSRYDEKAKAYIDKKLREGMSKRHARKCLARQLVNIVFRLLKD
jgi:transposase